MLQASTLVPGLLVSLKTSVRGNVNYNRIDLEPEHITESGEKKARWETEKRVSDPAEHENAIKVRSKAVGLVRSVCAASSFGLLCPLANTAKLEKAIEDARTLADEFNRSATLTQVKIFVIAGRVASDDPEAIRAINSEIRDLMANMEEGVSKLDVEKIRDAANRAKQIIPMLSPKAQESAQMAIDAVRAAARKIVKAEDGAKLEIDQMTLESIKTARTAFLDLEEAAELQAANVESRAIEFEPEETVPESLPETQGTAPMPVATPASVPSLELD